MTPKIKVISKAMKLGEGPHWDEHSQSLYFVDIHDCSIHKYDSKTGVHTQAKIAGAEEEPVSIIIPIENEVNKFVVTSGISIGTISWDGVSDRATDFKVLETLDEGAEMRINDGKASPDGVLFAGTMKRKLDPTKPNTGFLYSFKDMKAKKLLDGITISNGLAWSLDEKLLYYIDSMKRSVNSYEYDRKTAELSNEKVVFDFDKHNLEGFPDGMTIDSDGNLWIACYGVSQVINVDPREGKLLLSIKLPAQFITSVAFGGPDFKDLYVTSALEGDINTNQIEPEDGFTFQITETGVRGLPATAIRL